jgi:NB-ARC domain
VTDQGDRFEVGDVGASAIVQQGVGQTLNLNVMARPESVTALFQLPADPVLVGREAEVARIVAAAARRPAVVSITGMGGVGKSALAVHAAHQMTSHAPEAQLYVSFTGEIEVLPTLNQLLVSLGVERDALPQDLAGALALYRSRCSGLRMLLLLDNVRDADDLAQLLPGGADAIVLTTSRAPLRWTVDAVSVSLTELDTESSIGLLCGVAGREVEREDRQVLEGIVARCAGLPLALRIVGARWRTVPHWPAEDVLSRLRSADDMLEAIDDDQDGVGASLQLSWDELEPAEADALSRLSVAPWAHVTDMYMWAFLGFDEMEAAVDLLDRLSHVQLLEPLGSGRYRLHDLVREFASRRLQDTSAFRQGIVDYLTMRENVLDLSIDEHLGSFAELEDSGRPHMTAAVEPDRENFIVDLRLCNEQGLFGMTIRLALSLALYLMLPGQVDDLLRTAELTAAAVEGKQRSDRPSWEREITPVELTMADLVGALASRARGASRNAAALRARARGAAEANEPWLATALWVEVAAQGIDDRDRSIWEPAVRVGLDTGDDPALQRRLADLGALGNLVDGDYATGESLLASIVAGLREQGTSAAAREYAEELLHWSVALRLTGRWQEAIEACYESREIWHALLGVLHVQLELATCWLQCARLAVVLKAGRYVVDDFAALETFFRERGFIVPQLIALRGLVAARPGVFPGTRRDDKLRLRQLERDVQDRTNAYPHTSPWSAILLGDLGEEGWNLRASLRNRA